MRKIKFRGQTGNGNWVFGFLLRKPYTEYSIVDKDGVEHVNVKADTIAQFIGLDKNSAEVYESDKIAYEYNGKTYTSTITLHPHTWACDEADELRAKDEKFIMSRYALVK